MDTKDNDAKASISDEIAAAEAELRAAQEKLDAAKAKASLEEVLAETRAKLGLDKPFLTRYVAWLNNSLHGDFGNRYVDDKPVLGEIQKALPATLVLAGAALCLTLVCSLSAGIVCALYEGTFLDRLIRGGVFLGTAMPSFWAGLLLMWLFAVKLDLVPTSGMDGPSSSERDQV